MEYTISNTYPRKKHVNNAIQMNAIDHLRNRLNFDLNKSRQNFHHSLKEHHKISNIPKFRCEML
jgi:hypothetical protein